MSATLAPERPITLPPEMSASGVPEWLYPPDGREWTVDDLDDLPEEAPRRLEIIDGALIIMSPQRVFHFEAVDAIKHALKAMAPDGFKVMRESTVALPNGDAPVPDVTVIRESGWQGEDQTRVDVEHVVLAVEVVSPDSRKRDMVRKPQLYSGAGIEHYWVVHREQRVTTTKIFRRDAEGSYGLVDEQPDRITCAEPFDIEVDLSSKALGL